VIFIFGFRNRVADRGAAVAATCPRCHNSVVLHHLHVRKWFTFFFVPLLPLGLGQRLLVCPICRWSREVPRTAEPLTAEMTDITKQWQSGAMPNDEYTKRVEAYWAFSTPDAGPAQSDVEAS
jgi:hypothetical protein